MKQHEAVIQAMQENGGFATLGYLYGAALKVPGCKWGTKTPFASIRRIVQKNPSFFRIRPGLWALTSERENVLGKLALSEQVQSDKTAEFNHTYYQGLIVEIGNLRGYKTYIPAQDKHKPFLQRNLSEIATLPEYYNFTYDHLLRKGKMVDVTWFNERGLPHAFFEVEHTTNIQNSLLKFMEFRDFRVEFFIAADTMRREEFEAKIAYSAFSPIRSEVRFVDYETLSELHTRICAIAAMDKLGLISVGP